MVNGRHSRKRNVTIFERVYRLFDGEATVPALIAFLSDARQQVPVKLEDAWFAFPGGDKVSGGAQV